MKLFVVLCFAAVAFAAPAQKINYSNDDVQLLSFENENPGLGNFRFAFKQTDGQAQEQQGEVINEGREDESIVIRGSYTWTDPEGVTYVITYIADDNGFQPVIEQGPGGGVPPAVVASLLG